MVMLSKPEIVESKLKLILDWTFPIHTVKDYRRWQECWLEHGDRIQIQKFTFNGRSLE